MSSTTTSVATAARWRLLALGLTPPRAETVAELALLADALLDEDAPDALGALVESLAGTDAQELAAQYHALFGGKVRVPPYEASYELDPLRGGRQISDVAAFYRAFGAEAHGPASERPDHAGCELEFLAFVELRRLEALEGDDPSVPRFLDELETEFLREHAGRWLPAFFDEVRGASDQRPVYRALAALGRTWLDEELDERGIERAQPPARRRRLSVERDRIDCG